MAFPGLGPGAPGCAYRKTGRRPLLCGRPSFFLGRQPAVRILLEIDGPVVDVQPAYWLAYQKTVADLGLARIDQATFWRLVRSGATTGQILRGSKPHHWKHYEARFVEFLDTDECVAQMRLRPDGMDALLAMSPRNTVVSIDTMGNLPARRRIIESGGNSVPSDRLAQVAGSLDRRAHQLVDLAAGDPHAIVIAASDRLVRAASEAGLSCIGIANGPCTEARLTQAGATRVFDCLGACVTAANHASGGWREVARL